MSVVFQKHKLFSAPSQRLTQAVPVGPNDGLCFRNTKSPHGGRAMSCAFDLDHYRELLDAAQAGGYRFAFFEGAPERRRR